eukprot:NODE_202_length_2042_cov_310.901656_g158_i0.p1 GENE.NODE_202_length_2042_cov_310.901656_g158_i0~~NODE_202_length_2042_cov_310.901656_g158_i0.p1  ORF type:complete len:558 (-),score=112.32 NODE_202_length_2042_cov_310.901656_g158_i0:41-1714(-)
MASEYKLFVGNLPLGAAPNELTTMMSRFGVVQDIFVMTKASKTGHVGAFVKFGTQEEADAAIAGIHNIVCFPGSSVPMELRYHSKPLQQAASPAYASQSLFVPNAVDSAKLFVGNLPANVTVEGLAELFAPYCSVVDSHILNKSNPSGGKGAMVHVAPRSAADVVIQNLNDKIVVPGAEEAIVVRFADSDKTGGSMRSAAHNTQLSLHQIPAPQLTPFAAYAPALVPATSYSSNSYSSTNSADSAKLFVGNLPSNVTVEGLTELFSSHATVVDAHILNKTNPTGGKGAMVHISPRSQAEVIIQMLHDKYIVPGAAETLVVRYADSDRTRSAAAACMSQPYAIPTYGMGVPPLGMYPPNASSSGRTHSMGEVKLFVGNLPVSYTQDHVAGLFAAYGTVLEAFIFTRPNPTGAKCGFVRFADGSAAAAAIAALHGAPLEGMSLVVRIADSHKGTSRPASNYTPNPPAPDLNTAPNSVTANVLNLPLHYSDTDLHALVAHCGPLLACQVIADPQATSAHGSVTFATVEAAQLAQSTLNDFQASPTHRLKVLIKAAPYKPY